MSCPVETRSEQEDETKKEKRHQRNQLVVEKSRATWMAASMSKIKSQLWITDRVVEPQQKNQRSRWSFARRVQHHGD